jgi:hypothetical protein
VDGEVVREYDNDSVLTGVPPVGSSYQSMVAPADTSALTVAGTPAQTVALLTVVTTGTA